MFAQKVGTIYMYNFKEKKARSNFEESKQMTTSFLHAETVATSTSVIWE